MLSSLSALFVPLSAPSRSTGSIPIRHGRCLTVVVAAVLWMVGSVVTPTVSWTQDNPGIRENLEFDSKRIYTSGQLAKVCLDFVQYVETDQDYQRFFEVSPMPNRPLTYSNAGWEGVCIAGLEYSTDYNIRVKPGLLGENHTQVFAPIDVQVETGLRDSELSFATRNYVLPANKQVQIPIESINLHNIKLELYRINPRNLMDTWLRSEFQSAGLYDSDVRMIENELGEKVWSDHIRIPMKANEQQTSLAPIPLLENDEPGLYLLTGVDGTLDENDYHYVDSQWFVRTDIGLTSFMGNNGLTVMARSLQSAEPKAEVVLGLLSQNNSVLAELNTDANGMAHFSAEVVGGEKGMMPAMLVARQDNDFTFLKLNTSPIDLSDRGASGPSPLVKMNVFAYAERGIYRRGDLVNVVGLLRDQSGAAISDMPLQARIIRPDQTVVDQRLLKADQAGGYHLDYQLSDSSASGQWRVAFYHSEQDTVALGSTSFLVADIVPPRIRVTFNDLPKLIRLYDGSRFKATADFLFGAPAADLEYEANMIIQPASTPFADYESFQFGNPQGKTDAQNIYIESDETDENGEMRIDISAEDVSDSELLSVPMEASLRVEVRDVNGRATSQKAVLPLVTEPYWVGVRALVKADATPSWWDEDDTRVTFPRDRAVEFEIATVDSVGQPTQLRDMTYRLVEEGYFYQWYEDNDHWYWRREFYDEGLQEGVVSYDDKGYAQLSFRDIDWGYYRLEIIDDAGALASVMSFRVGWSRGESLAGRPDIVELSTDKATYLPGELAQVHLSAPFAGQIQLMIASNGEQPITLVDQQAINADETMTVTIPVGEDWGAGAYLLATVYKPDEAQAEKGPNRAVGLQWIGMDHQAKELDVQIIAPEHMQSQQTLTLTVSAVSTAGADHADSTVYVTVAAVDEGVLQLDNFKTPSPVAHFFAQYRLPVELRDIYSYIIDAFKGDPAEISSGGDGGEIAEQSSRFRPDNDIKIVSLFSGIVEMTDGEATVALPVPDFNGELRLMAVAWNESQLGSASQPIKVSDPLVALLSKPRFMAVGDQSSITVQLFNQTRPETSYQVELVSRDGGLHFPEPLSAPVRLAQGDNATFVIPVEAVTVGSFNAVLRLKGSDGYQQSKSFMLGVRPPYTPVSQSLLTSVEPQSAVTLMADLAEVYDPMTVEGSVTLLNSPSFGLTGQLQSLDHYPYGCLEQTTSKAMPMLHFDALAKRVNYQSSVPADYRIRTAVDKLLDMQNSSGGFGLWRSGDNTAVWPSVYAIDFLTRAQAKGHYVPKRSLNRALSWLNRLVQSSEGSEEHDDLKAKLYGHYVLARNGYGGLELAHQRFRRYQAKLGGQPEAAMLGAAFALLGDEKAATEAFSLALQPVTASDHPFNHQYGYNYGTALRDHAIILTLAYEQGMQNIPQIASGSLVSYVNEAVSGKRWFSTQEHAWLALASLSIDTGGDAYRQAFEVKLDGHQRSQSIGEPIFVTAKMAQTGLNLENLNDQRLWVETYVNGMTWAPPSEQSEGVVIHKTLLNKKMMPAKLTQLDQGEIYLVHITGTVSVASDEARREMLLVDYLPAGFEIENADIENSAGDIAASWLEATQSGNYVEALDDRYVASFDAMYHHGIEQPDEHYFERLYVVRAVSKGRYTWPNAYIEDMVNPMIRGSTAVNVVEIR